MIEGSLSVENIEGALIMAFGAVCTQASVMHIIVTSCTGRESHAGKFLEAALSGLGYLMAPGTFHLCVPAEQGKVC